MTDKYPKDATIIYAFKMGRREFTHRAALELGLAPATSDQGVKIVRRRDRRGHFQPGYAYSFRNVYGLKSEQGGRNRNVT